MVDPITPMAVRFHKPPSTCILYFWTFVSESVLSVCLSSPHATNRRKSKTIKLRLDFLNVHFGMKTNMQISLDCILVLCTMGDIGKGVGS